MIEHLESRILLVGSIVNGVLRIVGGSEDDLINVQVGVKNTTVIYADATETFSTAAYSSILIDGGTGNDWIYCSGRFNRPGTINGGAGNDTISGSWQAETLNGGAGDDDIYYQLTDVIDKQEAGIDEFFFGRGPSEPNPTLVSGVLRFTGKDSGETVVVDAPSSTTLLLTYGGRSESYNASDVQSIIIDGRGGHDRIQINSNVLLPTRLYGGAGNDTIMGGSGSDRVWGGEGHDWIGGNGGTDILNGENGNDRMFGGDGRDHILSGGGTDLIRGENGVDQIFATGGDDDLRGNTGDLITLV